mmetsp:Transcript_72531/g.201145  ORF Transcript_72531/g.201145 Transcript_72531/m.201145 type:complete len:275 (+) Transcript_72531:1824-2648(+)
MAESRVLAAASIAPASRWRPASTRERSALAPAVATALRSKRRLASCLPALCRQSARPKTPFPLRRTSPPTPCQKRSQGYLLTKRTTGTTGTIPTCWRSVWTPAPVQLNTRRSSSLSSRSSSHSSSRKRRGSTTSRSTSPRQRRWTHCSRTEMRRPPCGRQASALPRQPRPWAISPPPRASRRRRSRRRCWLARSPPQMRSPQKRHPRASAFLRQRPARHSSRAGAVHRLQPTSPLCAPRWQAASRRPLCASLPYPRQCVDAAQHARRQRRQVLG